MGVPIFRIQWDERKSHSRWAPYWASPSCLWPHAILSFSFTLLFSFFFYFISILRYSIIQKVLCIKRLSFLWLSFFGLFSSSFAMQEGEFLVAYQSSIALTIAWSGLVHVSFVSPSYGLQNPTKNSFSWTTLCCDGRFGCLGTCLVEQPSYPQNTTHTHHMHPEAAEKTTWVASRQWSPTTPCSWMCLRFPEIPHAPGKTIGKRSWKGCPIQHK